MIKEKIVIFFITDFFFLIFLGRFPRVGIEEPLSTFCEALKTHFERYLVTLVESKHVLLVV